MFKTMGGYPIRINKPGMADLWAIIPRDGFAIHIEIEVKTGTGRLNKDQKIWKNFCDKNGIIFIEARDEVTTENEIKKALANK